MTEKIEKLIFIVDDNDANLTMAASILEKDYKVLTMPSAQKMFFLLEKKHPDLIILDIEMPEMNGLEAIVKVKENEKWKDIPVLFLTGWSDEKLLAKAAEAGALDVINKPIVAPALLENVSKYI
ncbi:MAG: response regulator [Treponema sp.]|nr:response regulator [Treponema sp.]